MDCNIVRYFKSGFTAHFQCFLKGREKSPKRKAVHEFICYKGFNLLIKVGWVLLTVQLGQSSNLATQKIDCNILIICGTLGCRTVTDS